MTDERQWKVGELARATGVTVRTLHHYDALGLLVPSGRSEAGYRLYRGRDVERLYRIRALQSLGLSLGDIAGVLDGMPLASVLERQIAHVDAQLGRLRRLRGRLEHLTDVASVDDLIETLEALEMHEKYFTQEQLDAIASRSDHAEEGQRAWAQLMDEVRREHDAGSDPRGPRMQELAARWRALIDDFTGGDTEILAALKRMYEHDGPTAASQSHGFTPELAAYMNEALRPDAA